MGGGGGYSFSEREQAVLEEMAKRRIQEASDGNKKHIFISFSHEDMDEVNLLRGQSKNNNSELEFSDYSVKKAFNSKDADYIKRKIKEKIEKSSVTLVYLTKKSLSSDWVKWEVEKSKEMGKGVIAVYPNDSPPKNLPSYITKNISKDLIVGWRHDDMMAAINKAAKIRST